MRQVSLESLALLADKRRWTLLFGIEDFTAKS